MRALHGKVALKETGGLGNLCFPLTLNTVVPWDAATSLLHEGRWSMILWRKRNVIVEISRERAILYCKIIYPIVYLSDFKVWVSSQQHPHVRTCQKCKFSDTTPNLLNQQLWVSDLDGTLKMNNYWFKYFDLGFLLFVTKTSYLIQHTVASKIKINGDSEIREVKKNCEEQKLRKN